MVWTVIECLPLKSKLSIFTTVDLENKHISRLAFTELIYGDITQAWSYCTPSPYLQELRLFC